MSTTTTADTAPIPAGALSGEPQWLTLEPEPVFAVLHTPPASIKTGLAALILPAFGWDDECSYRRRHDWAAELARAGITVARFDLPGTENSAGSPLAPGRARSWVLATEQAAHWLRERSGCERLTAIGIGLGGMLAWQAAALDAPIDDLILWGVRASGRSYVRELRAYAAMTARDHDRDAARSDGAFGIGGHLMSEETATALSGVNLTELALPRADRRRVLLIGRDAHGVDQKLAAHLRAESVEVSTLECDEYKGMMLPPDLELTPTAVIGASLEWMLASDLSEDPASDVVPVNGSSPVVDSVCFEHLGVTIRERILRVDTDAGALWGVLSEPAAGPRAQHCLVTVNSGALRHTGPNRLFVEIGRRAAAAGIPAARFDLPGLGDSEGMAVKSFERTAAHEPGSLAAIGAIYDHLERIGVAERFVAGGFSLGGYLTVRMALSETRRGRAERRLIGAISVNPTGFSWTVKQRKRAIRDFTAMAGEEALMAAPRSPEPPPRSPEPPPRSPEPAPRSPEPGPPSRQLKRMLEARARARLAHFDRLWNLEHRREIRDLRRGLEQLRESDLRVWLLLSEGEPLLRMLEQPGVRSRLASAATVEVQRLPDEDHLLRPLWIQDLLVERVSAALREV